MKLFLTILVFQLAKPLQLSLIVVDKLQKIYKNEQGRWALDKLRLSIPTNSSPRHIEDQIKQQEEESEKYNKSLMKKYQDELEKCQVKEITKEKTIKSNQNEKIKTDQIAFNQRIEYYQLEQQKVSEQLRLIDSLVLQKQLSVKKLQEIFENFKVKQERQLSVFEQTIISIQQSLKSVKETPLLCKQILDQTRSELERLNSPLFKVWNQLVEIASTAQQNDFSYLEKAIENLGDLTVEKHSQSQVLLETEMKQFMENLQEQYKLLAQNQQMKMEIQAHSKENQQKLEAIQSQRAEYMRENTINEQGQSNCDVALLKQKIKQTTQDYNQNKMNFNSIIKELEKDNQGGELQKYLRNIDDLVY